MKKPSGTASRLISFSHTTERLLQIPVEKKMLIYIFRDGLASRGCTLRLFTGYSFSFADFGTVALAYACSEARATAGPIIITKLLTGYEREYILCQDK